MTDSKLVINPVYKTTDIETWTVLKFARNAAYLPVPIAIGICKNHFLDLSLKNRTYN